MLGIDYIDRRNSLIEKVTLDDIKRVAKRLLDGGMLVTVVGRAHRQRRRKKRADKASFSRLHVFSIFAELLTFRAA